VRYHQRGEKLIPDYVCDRGNSNRVEAMCQSMSGRMLDAAVGKALIESVTPATLQLALAVQEEIVEREAECDRLRQMQVTRARYEAQTAERRYKHVDPANRLVASTLETEWNNQLSRLREAEEEYERTRLNYSKASAEARKKVLQLAKDFPKFWQNDQTTDRERKQMVRLLLKDVTVVRDQEQITAHVRFNGGMDQKMQVPVAQRTDPKTIATIDSLLESNHNLDQIAVTLNHLGTKTARGKSFNFQTVYGIIKRHLPHRAAGVSNSSPTVKTPFATDARTPTQVPTKCRGAV
jgi:hypothetical protein